MSISDLVLAVDIALGIAPLSDCVFADQKGNGLVDISDLVAGVAAALSGCPVPPSGTATAPEQSPTPSPTTSPNKPPRLNFLVINLDDARPDGLDHMAQLQSRLASESMTFGSSFVPFASCASSRASLFSGLYAVHHGTRAIAGPIGGAKSFRESGADRQTIAVWLHDAGYATGLFGKYINAYNGESTKGPGGGYYIPPGWTRWRAFPVEHYGGIYGPGYDLVDERGVVTHYDDHTSDAQYSTYVTAQATRQFIADSTAAGQPFFAYWAPYAPHGDGSVLAPIPAAADLGTLKNALLPYRPPNFAQAGIAAPRWDATLPFNDGLIAATDEIRELAYESLLSVDRELGAMLDQLDALGIAEHTVILLTSDNGVAWGEHAQSFQSKGCPYEECLRVPLLIHVPDGAAPGLSTSPALNIDVAPTIADLADVAVPVAIDGHSLQPALTNSTEPIRDDFLLEQWREVRGANLTFDGQPADGDRLRLYYGAGLPKTAATFEFDTGDGVGPNSIPVAIQATPDQTFQALGNAVHANVPKSAIAIVALSDTGNCPHPPAACTQLTINDTSAALTGFYWWEDVNQSGNFSVSYPLPDYFGVRDVTNGYTYVQYEDGEAELYDLRADPWELNNVAGDPAYASLRAALDSRMRELAGIP